MNPLNWIKHLFTGHIFPWVAHAVRDAKAWLAGIATVIGGAVLQSYQAGALDIAQCLTWTRQQWAEYLAKVGIPALLAFFLGGRPHQTAAEIAAKLEAADVQIVKPDPKP